MDNSESFLGGLTNLTAIYEPAEEGGYIVYIKEFPGINTQGETKEEAKANLEDAYRLMYEEIEE